MQYKDISASTLDVDTTGRKVKIVISEMGSLDLDNDVIAPGAYDKTIAERGPKGKNLIVHLRDHNPSISEGLIGKFSELYVEGKRLIGIDDIPETIVGNDTLKMYQAGLINQHSIGFTTIKSEDIKGKDDSPSYRLITQVKAYEGSAVLWGANMNTPMLGIMKSEDKADIMKKISDQVKLIAKEIRHGKYTDQNFSLLEIYSKQLEDLYEAYKTTPAADKAPEPDNNRAFADHLLLLTL